MPPYPLHKNQLFSVRRSRRRRTSVFLHYRTEKRFAQSFNLISPASRRIITVALASKSSEPQLHWVPRTTTSGTAVRSATASWYFCTALSHALPTLWGLFKCRAVDTHVRATVKNTQVRLQRKNVSRYSHCALTEFIG